MSEPTVNHFHAADGVTLAWQEIGEGRPVVLIHGLFSNGYTNWIRYGHAARLARAGFRVIMPDLRGHGLSGAPHDAAAYPPDVLARDGLALVAELGFELGGYDLGGYSLGARTAARMLVMGARPRRAILSGMGLAGMQRTSARAEFFRNVLKGIGTHAKGSPEWMAEAFLKTTGGDPRALLSLLDSFVDTSEAEMRAIEVETLVLCGIEDDDNGSAAALAEMLPHARFQAVPGNHMSAVLAPELGQAMVDFLAG